jgi:hypothetical protein
MGGELALFAYRRQEFLRDICQLVGYNGRNLWVVRTEDVTTLGAKWKGASRISYVLLGLNPLKALSLEKEDNVTVILDANIAVAALPKLRGRRGTMMLFIHPVVYDSYKWSSRKTPTLKLEELQALRGNKTTDPATEHVGKVLCYHRGLMTAQFERTDLGTSLLMAHVGRKVIGPLKKQG